MDELHFVATVVVVNKATQRITLPKELGLVEGQAYQFGVIPAPLPKPEKKEG